MWGFWPTPSVEQGSIVHGRLAALQLDVHLSSSHVDSSTLSTVSPSGLPLPDDDAALVPRQHLHGTCPRVSG